MAHRIVAKKRHRAMRDLTLGLDFRPPDAAMAKADAVLVQRLGGDDGGDPWFREIAEPGQMSDAAEAAGLFVHRARYFDGAGKVGIDFHESLGGNDRGGQAPLHVAGATAIDLAIPDDAREGV